ncbi:smoothelin [Conger conger]|uniref:smoothelin n=1 Tax=Conger conger TaxID=82655 RepID=UPI002A5A685D|nr:smoothelin [Conger conger]
MEPGVELKQGGAPVDKGPGASEAGAASGSPKESGAKLTLQQLATIEEEEALDRMLDETSDFEERKLIRTALRDLRKKKRAQREQDRAAGQQQKEEQNVRPAGGAAGEKPTLSSAHKGAVQTQSSSSCNKKVGSISTRQDDSPLRGAGGGSSGLRELERRQAEKRKELMKPKSSITPTRQAVVQKLERESGGTGLPGCRMPRSPVSGVPNSKNIKQMLLDWCRAKTDAYEGVDIQNFSSSWSDGLAFCALVHHFFPHAFDYSSLGLTDRRHRFETAFNTAERLADCPALLDVEDMIRMREPDWKCVYTYIQEFYRNLVQKGLVKTKKSC